MGNAIGKYIGTHASTVAEEIADGISMNRLIQFEKKSYFNGLSVVYAMDTDVNSTDVMTEHFRKRYDVTGNIRVIRLIKKIIKKELVSFYENNNEPKYRELNISNLMYLSKELSRSIVAHVIGDIQVFSEFESMKLDVAPLSHLLMVEMSRQIAQTPMGVLNYDDNDPTVMRALNIKFAKHVMAKMETYDAQGYIREIYAKLFVCIDKKKAAVSNEAVGKYLS